MTGAPRFSVLIPSYNHVDFLRQAVESALLQDPEQVEVLLLDDGSSDGTSQLLRELEGLPGLRIERQENAGAANTLNRLLKEARGRYCAILNSDDVYRPGRLLRLAEMLEKNPGAIIATSWIRIIDEGGRELGLKEAWMNLPPWPRPHSGPTAEDLGDPTLALLQTNWVSTTSNILFRRDRIEERMLRFSSLRYCHDWDFLLSAAHFGEIALAEDHLLDYRVHGANTIAEGTDASGGQALMHWEILWTVARHAARVLELQRPGEELGEDIFRSLPHFGHQGLLVQLLALRGSTPTPPGVYEALLEPGHPFRETALRSLGSSRVSP